ncbi:MAG: metallo-mystery pair system four-Cys motif protein [Gammaproteobacteria bacterium]|nr:metallo-mystery pair system four-Cys motif protein [Gammaproteobacteria bacterium]MDH5240879.1 metallo-mystery pair system four-Cys motif protein [Gammaproteobacteria bacterium]MDH5584471.1 metallo-mystery pair system four-Cys motif protein [Gammaproteobacteria bacterium]
MRKTTTSSIVGSGRWAKRQASCFLVFTLCFAACSSRHVPVNLEFVATWDGQPLQCSESGVRLTDLRFFISSVTLLDSDGNERALELLADGRWQQAGVALVDLENGAADCVNGSLAMNSRVSGITGTDEFSGLRFVVGVPFDLNHANPLTALPPLDDAAMHWHWRSGYKFLRAGVATDGDGFWLHLGSTGCAGTVQNISGCSRPNRVLVELADFSPTTDQIEVDLSALFRDVDLDDGVRSDCSSGPAEVSCAEPFSALGLEFDEKTTVARPPSQSVFRVWR